MRAKKRKQRLDLALVERGLFQQLDDARKAILAGEIWTSDTQRLEHAGSEITEDTAVFVKPRSVPFVGRAGVKLDGALDELKISVQGLVCVDVGAATGGFTDCLLQRGAKHVFAVDVGYGLLDSKLRNRSDVSVVERTNARHLTQEILGTYSPLAQELSFFVVDVSFISVNLVLPTLSKLTQQALQGIVLLKPQFEADRAQLRSGGRVTDIGRQQALEKFVSFCQAQRYHLQGPLESSLAGKKSKNVEFLFHVTMPSGNPVSDRARPFELSAYPNG